MPIRLDWANWQRPIRWGEIGRCEVCTGWWMRRNAAPNASAPPRRERVIEENLFYEQQSGAQHAAAGLIARTKAPMNSPSTSFPSSSTLIKAPIRQEGPRVLDAVNPRGLDLDVVKTRFGEFRHVLVVTQDASDATHPKLHAVLDFGRYLTPDNNIGDARGRISGTLARETSRRLSIVTRRLFNHMWLFPLVVVA